MLTEKVAKGRWRQAWQWWPICGPRITRDLQGSPGVARNGPKPGETAREASLSLQKGHGFSTPWFLTSSFQNCRIINLFCFLSLSLWPVCDHLLPQPQQTRHFSSCQFLLIVWKNLEPVMVMGVGKKDTHTLTLSYTLTLSHTLWHTHTLSHTLALTLIPTYAHAHTLTHSYTLDNKWRT